MCPLLVHMSPWSYFHLLPGAAERERRHDSFTLYCYIHGGLVFINKEIIEGSLREHKQLRSTNITMISDGDGVCFASVLLVLYSNGMKSGEGGKCECLVRKDTACAVSSSSSSIGLAGAATEESLSKLAVQGEGDSGKGLESGRDLATVAGQSLEDTPAFPQ